MLNYFDRLYDPREGQASLAALKISAKIVHAKYSLLCRIADLPFADCRIEPVIHLSARSSYCSLAEIFYRLSVLLDNSRFYPLPSVYSLRRALIYYSLALAPTAKPY